MSSISKITILSLIMTLSFLTMHRNLTWKSEMFMWIDATVKSPIKARPHNGLGMVYSELQKTDVAIRSFATAIKLNPNFYIAHNNLGAELFRKGMYFQASRSFKKALDFSFVYPEAHNNLGSVYAVSGELDKAIAEFELAFEQNIFYIDPLLNLARAYILKSDKATASLYLDRAFTLNPSDKEALELREML